MGTPSFFGYTTAIVRGVAKSLPVDAQRLDPNSPLVTWEKMVQQTKNYVDILRNQVGLKVIELPADDSQPDCVFVEDTVVAIGNQALITTPGYVSRQPEIDPMMKCLRDLEMKLISMKEKNADARMDGGDVLFTGEEIFVGLSSRTNQAGCDVLADAFPSFPVTVIPVQQVLHLKSSCSLAKPGVILQAVGTPKLVEMAENFKSLAKKQYSYIEVDGKSAGANCLYIDSPTLGGVVVHQPYEVFPESKKAYDGLLGVRKIECDISEFDKVDGALTCCSVLLAI